MSRVYLEMSPEYWNEKDALNYSSTLILERGNVGAGNGYVIKMTIEGVWEVQNDSRIQKLHLVVFDLNFNN